MKLITLSLLLASAVTSLSATVAVSRSGLGVVATTAGGTALTTGGYYIGVGSFTTIPTITNAASLLAAVAAFNEFASALSPSAAGGTQGTITGSFTGGLSNASLYNSKEIYMVVGNGTTRALSTEFAIIQGTPTWNFTSDTSAADSISVIMRDVTSFTPLANAGTEIDVADPLLKDGLRLVAIPEVSSVFLMGLSGLLLAVRRRK